MTLFIYAYVRKEAVLSAAKRVGVSFPTASQAVAHMQKLGILREITRKRRHRLFVYEAYLAIPNEGTEPLA